MRNKIFLYALLSAAVAIVPSVLIVSCSRGSGKAPQQQASSRKSSKYYCPMHPNYTAEKPGDCPVCGMNLVPSEEAVRGSGTATVPNQQQSAAPVPQHKKRMYRSPMHPNEVSDKPGKDSMGMEMEPFDVEEPSGPQVEGYASVTIPPEKQRLLGVTIAAVERKEVCRTVRTTGRVAYDPDLYYAEQEYIAALQTYDKSKAAGQSAFAESSRSLVDAAKYRLKLLGLGDAQIEALGNSGTPDKRLLTPGPGQGAWVYASIFEADVAAVKPGQTAVITLSSGGDKLTGTVTAIEPVLDPQTRSARARILVERHPGTLTPESYGSVEIQVPLGVHSVVPSGAVMDTGTRRIVFVDKGQGVIEPREVRTGPATDDETIIESGVMAGERVVTNANFLIDSESQLKATVQSSGGGHHH